MKQLVFAAMMCVSAMSAKAQVLTSETVKNSYETVINLPESDFAYNADYTGDDITTMYVYQRNDEGKDILLTPYRKHEYTYATDQRDTSHRNAPPLCRAVTVRLQLIKKMPSPFTDMPEMPINRWLAGKHGACGRSTLLPLRLHSMGCQRDSCSCQ
jgi:hypothetical protein